MNSTGIGIHKTKRVDLKPTPIFKTSVTLEVIQAYVNPSFLSKVTAGPTI